MKKLIVFALLLGMLLPMGMVASASETKVEKAPFYMINFMDDITDYDNIYVRVNFQAAAYKEGDDGITINVNWLGQKSSNISKIAQIVKEEFDSRPKGTRFICFPKLIDTIVEPDNMIYLEKGTQLYADWMEKFFKEYAAIGGKMDGVELDVEYNGMSAYYINQAFRSASSIKNDDGQIVTLPADTQIYKKIVEHPLYATEVRPLLEERGFTFITPSGDKSEIFNISETNSVDAEIWDAVMHNRMCQYLNEACAPIFKYFPDIMVTNYCYSSEKAWFETTGQKGGVSLGGNTGYAGSVANQNFYVRRPYKQFYDTTNGYSNPVAYNGAVYADTVYNSFLFEINTIKDMYASSDTKRISTWIAGFNYDHSARPTNSTRLSPYYAETILHIGLLNPEVFLGYIVGPRDTDNNGDGYDYEDNMKVTSELLNELTRLVGTSDRKAVFVPKDWNNGYVLSGMYANGRNVWRLTPDTTEGQTIESFKVDGADPTFKINGQTITFPKGKIIEDGKVSIIGTCGYWIETPADVTPIIVSDVDRYRQSPAFGENYDAYETGMEYTYDNVKIPGIWQVKKDKTATAVIQEDKNNAGNKVLAVTGSYTLKNAKVVGNITAGDTFAEDQTWEVTATIPANMGTDAELTLLSIYGSKTKPIDGGFKVAEGKLYYYNTDKYVAFEGVDVSAGGKFTLKREMNFNTADALTCDYIVCDSTGKKLAVVKDIPVGEDVKLPIQTIGLDFSDVTETVYIDDYKLYAAGATADFKLYDAKTGIRVAELDKARDSATAYRVSWMNATAYDKVYSVVAAYYNGDKLVEEKVIQEIKMAPGTDYVDTGIVGVEDGQSVRIYVRNDSKPESEDNPTDGPQSGDVTEPDKDIPVMLIAIIAGAAVLVAVIVVVIVVTSKKKKASPAAEVSEDKSAE